jgi:predicted ABC-type ATPase
VERVKRRVLAGGHDVPEDKVRDRHRRLWSLVATAATRADTATVYDNSHRKGPRIVAQTTGGVAAASPSWPSWTAESLRSD